jgi:DNA-binding transcriptional LysR family regulator
MTSLSPAAIAEQRVVIGGGAEIRRLVDDWFEARGAGLAHVMELPSFEGLRSAVIETAGVAFLPRDGLSEDLASGQLVPIDIEGFDVSAQAYVVHRHDLHEAAQWLVQLLAEQQAMPLTT